MNKLTLSSLMIIAFPCTRVLSEVTFTTKTFSSPPCLAAKCKDGIALLSIHVHENSLVQTSQSNDLLLDNVGPARIEQIDQQCVILNSGWRVDGRALADKGREICKQYKQLYGEEKGDDFGSHIGWGLVNYLVECHVQESVRSLSTCGLLATCHANRGDLFLVDFSGLYPCRALAIGAHSKDIYKLLAKVNFNSLTVQDGADELLQIVRKFAKEEKTKNTRNPEGNDSRQRILQMMSNDSIVELVTMHLSGELYRRRLSFSQELQ
jgi:20S proteasome alpha/beta subunit